MKGRGRFRHIPTLTAVLTALLFAGRLTAAEMEPDSLRDDTAIRYGARLSLVEDTHDFGDIQRRGGDATWRFEFVNDGDEPLIITRLATTCTCLKYKYPRRPVAAGQRGHIDISYQPHKTEAGAFHRVVKVYSNSADGVRMLIVQGNSIDNRRRRR